LEGFGVMVIVTRSDGFILNVLAVQVECVVNPMTFCPLIKCPVGLPIVKVLVVEFQLVTAALAVDVSNE
jgi:hypothetical protein